MVFHRFLAGQVPRRKRLTLKVNGNAVDPWDPFARDEGHTEAMLEQDFDVAYAGVAGVISFCPYVLPTKEEFSSAAAFDRHGGGRWNQSQGLWIYRSNRLIQTGGWSRLRAADEHTKFARAALDFFPDLDPAFGLNIAKMRVNLPPPLREVLKAPVEALCRRAKQRYNVKAPQRSVPGTTGRAPAGRAVTAREKPVGQGAAEVVGNTGAGVTAPAGPVVGGGEVGRHRRALEEAAEAVDEKVALERIARRLMRQAPEVGRELGW
jgi:hypothetical protein